MLRGAAAVMDGGTVLRAAGAGLASVAAIGEAAVQAHGLCARRRQPPHHSILSIHSQVQSNNSNDNVQMAIPDATHVNNSSRQNSIIDNTYKQ